MNSKPILAWHVSTGELDFDMKGTQVVAGLKVSINETPILNYKGLHGCIRPLDALRFFSQRPNPETKIVISRVLLSGSVIDDSRKIMPSKGDTICAYIYEGCA